MVSTMQDSLMSFSPPPTAPIDPNVASFKIAVNTIADLNSPIEKRLKAAQDLSESYETLLILPQYLALLPDMLKGFMKALSEGDPQFIAEQNSQQLRKLLLELIYRVPPNEQLKQYIKTILPLMFKLLEIDNEENVLVCLRLIIEYHKQFRPQFSQEVYTFLQFVKKIYQDLPSLMKRIFEPRQPIKVKDIVDINLEALLGDCFSVSSIVTEKKNQDNQPIAYSLVPRATQSLKVLAELPIIVVLMYQLYKPTLHSEVKEFVPLIMNTLTLQPSPTLKTSAAFNKEVFVDFIVAQVKTLSFLAYILKIYQDEVTHHSASVVKGLIGLLTTCPHEVAHLRKELLIAARHIFATDLRNRFVPCIDKLFDEQILMGAGPTIYESLRPLAYSTLADLVHHVRSSLTIHDLYLAVNLFSKNIHDDSLPAGIQTMSCRLLLNLVEGIRQKGETEGSNGRELFLRMLEVFSLKFKTIAEIQLPILRKRQAEHLRNSEMATSANAASSSNSASLQVKDEIKGSPPGAGSTDSGDNESEGGMGDAKAESKEDKDEKPAEDATNSESKSKISQSGPQLPPFTATECRGLVKTLVSGVKTITWGIASCKGPNMDVTFLQNKLFLPKETSVYIGVVKYALQALDVYMLSSSPAAQNQRQSGSSQSARTKEEKEVLEHFAGVFTMMSPQTFREIFQSMIDYLVQRISANYSLQIVANSFLANSATSATFATILVNYLLQHMEDMGADQENSSLYLKLFKLVFGSVSLLAHENEQMLKPHLHTIVNRSMELALTAKDPYNYFLLLRALFRSIGGGSHDLLYQEFLPLLPSLLQGLNSLQAGQHKQYLKDLFVELCLTVPVRLSSLLPYLPMLMDPLVSALNGSQTLVSQGLRTLELCVDNLQPDFLYDHIQPVRGELMQALWKCLSNSHDTIALVAFRVLGKFGGSNRKMLSEPQRLNYEKPDVTGLCVRVLFEDCKGPISLPTENVVDTAFTALKDKNCEQFYQLEAWRFIRCHIVASLARDDERKMLVNFFTHASFREKEIQCFEGKYNLMQNDLARKVQEKALAAMFVACTNKELRGEALPFMAHIVRQHTLVALSQQTGPFAMPVDKLNKQEGMDPFILIDALENIMADEDKELCKVAQIALALILDTCIKVLGTKDRACQLPLFEYIAERLTALCYQQAWFTKLGGCTGIKFLAERMTHRWAIAHHSVFFRALTFVMMDLSGEVSSGTLDYAKVVMEQVMRVSSKPICSETLGDAKVNLEDLRKQQDDTIYIVVKELIGQITSPCQMVREQAMHSLEVMAEVLSLTVSELMKPHTTIVQEVIPPKKHLLRFLPANAQIGIMDGTTFCTSLDPPLFKIDLEVVEHKVLYTELLNLIEAEDSTLLKQPCFKNVNNLAPLRKSAMRAIAACHYIVDQREKIFQALYKALSTSNAEVQEVAHGCMKKFIAGFQIDMDLVHSSMRPLLLQMGDYRSLSLNSIKVLACLTQLFPNTFNEKLCEQLLAHLKKWLEVVVVTQKGGVIKVTGQVLGLEMQTCTAIINLFHLIPAASIKMIEPLTTLVLKAEKDLYIGPGSPFHEPLMKFLIRYPQETISFILTESKMGDSQWSHFFHWMMEQDGAAPIRNLLKKNPAPLLTLLNPASPSTSAVTNLPGSSQSAQGLAEGNELSSVRLDIRFCTILIIYTVVGKDPEWLATQPKVVSALLKIWVSDNFQDHHRKVENVDFAHWQEPRYVIVCFINYFTRHMDEIELLFHTLRCLMYRNLVNYFFFKEFLETTVVKGSSILWKRKAFFKFIEIFHDSTWTNELKAKMMQFIIIPCFVHCFEAGEKEALIGGPPTPDQDNPDNLVTVFITKIIDPDNPFGVADCIRILLLELSSLLVEHAAIYIHDAGNKKQGTHLRRLMTYAWPCLLTKNCVDPNSKYHGHLLLAQIIAQFAIHRRIVLQVFHGLLKAHAVEARTVVRQALDVLTPSMPGRMEDGNNMLVHWTRKIIVEEGHAASQLVHILQLIVRHHKVYYAVRHTLVHHMVSAMSRLGLATNASMDHRKLAVDIAEVIIKRWEYQHMQEEKDASGEEKGAGDATAGNSVVAKAMEKHHSESIVTFLLRMACQMSESTNNTTNPPDMLSRRCVALLKMALGSDMWPNMELKLTWFEKLLVTVETQQPNYASVCSALELLTLLLTIIKKEVILTVFRPLQRGIAACMTCSNTKVVKTVHNLLMKLMSIYPTEPTTSTVASKYEELEGLYGCVSKVIHEGLGNYEKSSSAAPSQLFSTLMILKAACTHNPCYIDRLITNFMRVLQRMSREHVTPTTPETNPALAVDLLILSLDLVKNRVGVLGQDMRKAFIGSILVGLIEKTTDAKLMKAITKMLEDWVKAKSPVAVNQTPSVREKAILLVKLMQHVEKRFPDEVELNNQFLELVLYIYKDDSMAGSELTAKLEPAFLSGLRCSQTHIRAKFSQVYDTSVRKKMQDRLLYIFCTQNWEHMGNHYWIKQCIELILTVSVDGKELEVDTKKLVLPGATAVLSLSSSEDKSGFSISSQVKEEPMDVDGGNTSAEEEIDYEMSEDGIEKTLSKIIASSSDVPTARYKLLQKQADFIDNICHYKVVDILGCIGQLCHGYTSLAHTVWVTLFPRLWKVLTERMMTPLEAELTSFIASGSHVIQRDSHPSALNTFCEAIWQCVPPIVVRPPVIKYLGKTHNLWHRACLLLEQMAFDSGLGAQASRPRAAVSEYDFEPVMTTQQETLDALCELYSLLKEEDLLVAVWLKRAKYQETNIALAYEQHGYFEQAQQAYEQAMSKGRVDHNAAPASPQIVPEYRLWEDHWIRCCKELNQWDHLLEFANSKSNVNTQLVLDSAWRVPNWGLMKEALNQQSDLSHPKELNWKVTLYKGFTSICHPDEAHLAGVDRMVEMSSSYAIREWRRLPHIVSHIHVQYLQAAQQIMELQEAAQINQGLQPTNIGRESSAHDMKAIVKTWRNRLPMISDDLSHWSDIFTWRQHHYQQVVSQYEAQASATHDPNQSNNSMLGVHASAQSIIHFGKIARKHGLTGVCLDSLSRIHTIPSVPIVDCFQKIRQQVKCYLQMAAIMGKNELQEGLEVIESTNLKYFSKEMTAEFYAIKGMFLAQIGRSDDANKAFSAAVQMHDTQTQAWALWGDYLESLFTREKQIDVGTNTIICFLHACRNQSEYKSRRYLAKVLWLLTYDNENQTLAEAVDKYSVGVPPIQWLPWIPQLLVCLVRNEGKLLLNLLSKVGSVYPQAVYFPLRTLYLTLKIEQREKHKTGDGTFRQMSDSGQPATPTEGSGAPGTPTSEVPTSSAASSDKITVGISGLGTPTSTPTSTPLGATFTPSGDGSQSEMGSTEPIRATAPMWRCSRIMHMQRDIHPTILHSLEGIVDQMVWFRENWYEEVSRQLQLALIKCHNIAFENRTNVLDSTVTTLTMNFVKKLVTTFGVGIENVSSISTVFSSSASECLARRALASAQDPVFQKLKQQFTNDFDFNTPGSDKLHNLINKLKKWVKILEAKIKVLPKSFLLEEKCRFLSNFTMQTAEVEIPGEFLLPKHSHYYVRIARFLPSVDIVHKQNFAARRLYIRGHNGKIYPYLVINDAGLSESRREERVLQLSRMLGQFLTKMKESSRRLLNLVVPRVVAISPQMRLVEDHMDSMSLMDVYKQCCSKRNMDHDGPITRYYERLASMQARGLAASHQVLRDVLRDVQANQVPRTMIKEWAAQVYPNATDYWTFRKNFTAHLAVQGFLEFVLHLTKLSPNMIYIYLDSGAVSVAYYVFDIDEHTGDLDANRPVPFRLSPNLGEFITPTGVSGPLTAIMITIARCLVQPQYKVQSILKALLRDEFITWYKKRAEEQGSQSSQPAEIEGEFLIQVVNKAVSAIMSRLQSLATFDGAESRVSTLVAAASSLDNLCRMDPTWHPWL